MDSEEDKILYILNENNKLLTKGFVNDILKRYGVNYKIHDLYNFQVSLTHKSYIVNGEPEIKHKNSSEIAIAPISDINDAIPLQKECYERFEILGDSLYHHILTEYLFIRYPDENEGFITKLRSKLENKNTLFHISLILGFDDYVLISKSVEVNTNRKTNYGILEDVFEAFIAALYLDGGKDGFHICKQFVINLIETEIEIPRMICNETNYKDLLNKYFGKMGLPFPNYITIKRYNTINKSIFVMGIMDYRNELIGIGRGLSKKKGEQEAARRALINYNIVKSYQEEEYNDLMEAELD